MSTRLYTDAAGQTETWGEETIIVTLGALFVTSLAVGFSGAVTPGPLLVACITQSARGGFRAGWLVAVGHALIELVLVVALCLGLGAVLGRTDVAFSISLIGGLVLLWMGWTTTLPAWRGRVELPNPEHNGIDGANMKDTAAGPGVLRGSVGAVVAGVAATVSGPFWIIWWATVGLSYLSLASPLGTTGIAAFYLGHVSADFVWYSVVTAAVAGGRRILSPRAYRALLVGCGLCLGALGVFFAGRGVLALVGVLV